jgi:hypothetical protein
LENFSHRGWKHENFYPPPIERKKLNFLGCRRRRREKRRLTPLLMFFEWVSTWKSYDFDKIRTLSQLFTYILKDGNIVFTFSQVRHWRQQESKRIFFCVLLICSSIEYKRTSSFFMISPFF